MCRGTRIRTGIKSTPWTRAAITLYPVLLLFYTPIIMAGGGARKHHNGRRYTAATKKQAKALRSAGFSIGEIAQKIHAAESTIYLWTQDILLTTEQKEAIEQRRKKHPCNNNHAFTFKERLALGRRLAPYQFKKQHSKKSLINEIRLFFEEHGRIPLKKEFNSRRAFRLYFGSWNNAIIAAGFEPNPELFAKRVLARDGHICDSFAEKIIDDWLAMNKIPHERNIRYPGSRMTADFFIKHTETYVEFFGLKGVNKKYDTHLQNKLLLVREHALKFIPLYTEDIQNSRFTNKLQQII